MHSSQKVAGLLAVSLISFGLFPFVSSAQNSTPAVLTSADLRAQRTFGTSSGSAVSMDFQHVDLEMTFDPSAEQTLGRTTIQFTTIEQGRPYFLLDAPIQSVTLDGQPVETENTLDPPGLNRVVLVSQSVAPGVTHTLEVQYSLSSENVSYREGGIGFVTSMADIDDGNFLEKYAPTNFEDDQFSTSATLNLANMTHPHRLFTNGSVTQNGPTTWKIEFPSYFSTSSYFFHLTDKEFAVETGVYRGLEREIPYTVYSNDASAVRQAVAALPGLFSELESAYGPYYHQSFTAFISGAGGMEHSGATITSLSALGHELTHSWFARGVMPSNGNTGWIDEGIATWRDEGYQRNAPSDRIPANLAGFSIYERFTPYAAYNRGEQFMSELDYQFSERFGGLRPLLAEFFAQYRGQTVTTPIFENWLEQRTGTDLTGMFQRYVYGAGQDTNNSGAPGSAAGVQIPNTNHPPSLTPDEVAEIR